MSVVHFSTYGPICPHCSHRHQADESFYFDEDMVRMDCEHCEGVFAVRIERVTSWTTQLTGDPA